MIESPLGLFLGVLFYVVIVKEKAMNDKEIRDDTARMLREIRKQGYEAPRRELVAAPLVSDNGIDWVTSKYYEPEQFNKLAIETLLEGCKDTDWIDIQLDTDCDNYPDGYTATVMRVYKQSDDCYSRSVREAYEEYSNLDKCFSMKSRAKDLGIDVSDYQAQMLLSIAKKILKGSDD